MKVWAITFKEFGHAEEVVVERYGDTFRVLLFEDTPLGYAKALLAFQSTVRDRIGAAQASYSYPGEIGQDARAHIVVREADKAEHDECCGYCGDTIELRPYDVIGG